MTSKMTDQQIDDCLCLLIQGYTLEQAASGVGVSAYVAKRRMRQRHPQPYADIMAARTAPATLSIEAQRQAHDQAAVAWLETHRAICLEGVQAGIGIRRIFLQLRAHGYTGTFTVLHGWCQRQPGFAPTRTRRRNRHKGQMHLTGQGFVWKPIEPMDHPKLKPLRTYRDMSPEERLALSQRERAVREQGLGRASLMPIIEIE